MVILAALERDLTANLRDVKAKKKKKNPVYPSVTILDLQTSYTCVSCQSIIYIK